ncbi:glycosyltransferase family 2 protein [Lachnospiraceae bacterium 46-15]
MIKIQKDPITNKILCCTKVRPNTPIYSTDILIDEKEIPEGLTLDASMIFTDAGEFIEQNDKCDDEVQEICSQIQAMSSEGDYDYFMRMILEGAGLAEARAMVKARREERAALTIQLEEKRKEHKQHIKEHYRIKNKEKDAVLDCRYYSAVILLIKDENRYLKEWLDWHLELGFEHVYIYDNGAVDDVKEIVQEYSADMQSKITVIDWRGHHNHIQQDAYNHFLDNYKSDVRWGLFIDSDEFLRFTDGETEDVNTFLKNYEDYTEIWGYEVEYDANGQENYENRLVRERFTRQTDVREGFYWKNFIQVNRIDAFEMHYAYYDPEKHQVWKNGEDNKDLFVIDHYYTKSWEEWKRKIMERGGADPNYHKALREFFVYNPDMIHLDAGEDAVQAYE